jgi:hypothetical protein
MENIVPLRQQQISYELYQSLAEDLGMPIDPSLSIDVRLELYQSKMVYLRNLFEQAFVDANAHGGLRKFKQEDLKMLKNSAEITTQFIRQDLMSCVSQALDKAAERRRQTHSSETM